jgi:MFS family permease
LTIVINYYGPRIYESLGISTSTSLMITGINGTLGIVETSIALLIIDRLGRKWPLIIGGFGMAASMLIVAVLNKQFPADAVEPNGNALRAQVAMAFVFGLFFTSLGCISWIYPAEIFPTEIRALGTALSALTNWVCLLILQNYFRKWSQAYMVVLIVSKLDFRSMQSNCAGPDWF